MSVSDIALIYDKIKRGIIMNEKLKQNIKGELKIILISLAILFLYLVLALAEFTFTYPFHDHTHHPFMYTEIIAFCFLTCYLPITLLLFWIFPKLREKTKIRKFIFYFTLFGWVFAFVYWYISGIIYNLKVQ